MKKFIAAAIAAVVLAVAPATTLAGGPTKFGIANHLGATFGVGTTGIGIEVATPITQFIQARAGVSFMPGINFHVNTDATLNGSYNGQEGSYDSSVKLEGSLKRTQGSLIFNVYPFGNRSSFFVAVGGFFGGSEMIKIDGYCPDAKNLGGTVAVGDYELPFDKDGYAHGALRVMKFRPYFAIGTGRPCPGGRLNFMWELGIQIQKKPYVWDSMNKQRVDVSAVESNDDTFQKIMDHFSVYPVLKFTLSGRIF